MPSSPIKSLKKSFNVLISNLDSNPSLLNDYLSPINQNLLDIFESVLKVENYFINKNSEIIQCFNLLQKFPHLNGDQIAFVIIKSIREFTSKTKGKTLLNTLIHLSKCTNLKMSIESLFKLYSSAEKECEDLRIEILETILEIIKFKDPNVFWPASKSLVNHQFTLPEPDQSNFTIAMWIKMPKINDKICSLSFCGKKSELTIDASLIDIEETGGNCIKEEKFKLKLDFHGQTGTKSIDFLFNRDFPFSEWTLLSLTNAKYFTAQCGNIAASNKISSLSIQSTDINFTTNNFKGYFSNVMIFGESFSRETLIDLYSNGPNFVFNTFICESDHSVKTRYIKIQFSPCYDSDYSSNRFVVKPLIHSTFDQKTNEKLNRMKKYGRNHKDNISYLGNFSLLVHHLSPFFFKQNSVYSSEKQIESTFRILVESLRFDRSVQKFVTENLGMDCLKLLFFDPIPDKLKTLNTFVAIKELLVIFQTLGHEQVLEGIKKFYFDFRFWKKSSREVLITVLTSIKTSILSNPHLFESEISFRFFLLWFYHVNEKEFNTKCSDGTGIKTNVSRTILEMIQKTIQVYGSDFIDTEGFELLVYNLCTCESEKLVDIQLGFMLDIISIDKKRIIHLIDDNFGSLISLLAFFRFDSCIGKLIKIFTIAFQASSVLNESEIMQRGFSLAIVEKLKSMPFKKEHYNSLLMLTCHRNSTPENSGEMNQNCTIDNKIILKYLMKNAKNLPVDLKVKFNLDINILFRNDLNKKTMMSIYLWPKYLIKCVTKEAFNKIKIRDLVGENIGAAYENYLESTEGGGNCIFDIYLHTIKSTEKDKPEALTKITANKMFIKITDLILEKHFVYFDVTGRLPLVHLKENRISKDNVILVKNLRKIVNLIEYLLLDSFNTKEKNQEENLQSESIMLEKITALSFKINWVDSDHILDFIELVLQISRIFSTQKRWQMLILNILESEFFFNLMKMDFNKYLMPFLYLWAVFYTKLPSGKIKGRFKTRIIQLMNGSNVSKLFGKNYNVFQNPKSVKHEEIDNVVEIIKTSGIGIETENIISQINKNNNEIIVKILKNRQIKLDFLKKIEKNYFEKTKILFDKDCDNFSHNHLLLLMKQRIILEKTSTQNTRNIKLKISHVMRPFYESSQLKIFKDKGVLLSKLLLDPTENSQKLRFLTNNSSEGMPFNNKLSVENLNVDDEVSIEFYRWVSRDLKKLGQDQQIFRCSGICWPQFAKGIFVLGDNGFGFFGLRSTKKKNSEFYMYQELIWLKNTKNQKVIIKTSTYGPNIELFPREFLSKKTGIEIFGGKCGSIVLIFKDIKIRNMVLKILCLKNSIPYELNPINAFKASRILKKWQKCEISNFKFLLALNFYSGRSFNHSGKYPIFPWILNEYSQSSININDSQIYRDLSKPIGALNPERAELYKKRYNESQISNLLNSQKIPAFHYGTHYLNAATVYHYLQRIEPFTSFSHNLHDGKFDIPDRMFNSIKKSWNLSLTQLTDVKELIPEFFFFPNFLRNVNNIHFGHLQNGSLVNDVKLPKWSYTPEEFIEFHRKALESESVSRNLHNWVDLIFGVKQTGQKSIDSQNVFYYLMYPNAVNLKEIEDKNMKNATEQQIFVFGQIPLQILTSPCPKRQKDIFLEEYEEKDFGTKHNFIEFPKEIETIEGNIRKEFLAYKIVKEITNLPEKYEIPVCHSRQNNTLFIGGFQDNSIRAFTTNKLIPLGSLVRHLTPVSALNASNFPVNTINNNHNVFLASGDRLGRIVFWKSEPKNRIKLAENDNFLCKISCFMVNGTSFGPVISLSIRTQDNICVVLFDAYLFGVISLNSKLFVSLHKINIFVRTKSLIFNKRLGLPNRVKSPLPLTPIGRNTLPKENLFRSRNSAYDLLKIKKLNLVRENNQTIQTVSINKKFTKNTRNNSSTEEKIFNNAKKFLKYLKGQETIQKMFQTQDIKFKKYRKKKIITGRKDFIILYSDKNNQSFLLRYTVNGIKTHYKPVEFKVSSLELFPKSDYIAVSGDSPLVLIYNTSKLELIKIFSPFDPKKLKIENDKIVSLCKYFSNEISGDSEKRKIINNAFARNCFSVISVVISQSEEKLYALYNNGFMSLYDCLITINKVKRRPSLSFMAY